MLPFEDYPSARAATVGEASSRPGSTASSLLQAHPALVARIACDRLVCLSPTPPGSIPDATDPEAAQLAAWLDRAAPGGLVAIDSLPREAPMAGGVLGIGLQRERILWLRQPGGAPWSAAERAAAAELRTAWLEAALQHAETSAAREAAATQQEFLLAELDHRLKNVMANVQALVRLSRRNAASMDDFIGDLDHRLRAMAAAHGLLHHSRREGAQLRALVALELGAHATGAGGRVAMRGPDMRLRSAAALALSLALHELATNAAKHGALSMPEGRVWLSWRRVADGLLLRWHEAGGPPVRQPSRRGFGLTVITRSLAHGMGGESRLEFRASGLRCTLRLPVSQLTPNG